MDTPWTTRWIQDPRFAKRTVLNLFHKQHAPAAPIEHDPALQNVHMLVRKSFDLPCKVSAASLYGTADDYYHLYLNGQFVGQGPAPGWPFHYNVNTWDIADHLVAGRNVIAVHVYYQGLVNRVWCSGDYRQGMFAEIHATMAGGESLRVASDETWRIKVSPAYKIAGTIGYDTQFTEDIDGRLLDRGWQETAFDDSGWSAPAVRPLVDTDYTFVDQITPPLTFYSRRPAATKQLAADRTVFDFGHEITARLVLRASGRSGQRVEVRYGEELNSDGSVRYQMRCNCTYQDFCTLAGVPDEQIEFFDYKAFRYVEVLNLPGPLRDTGLIALVRHYPYDEHVSSFRSSNPVVDDLWTICACAVRNCAQETLVDCPSREKGPYVMDAAVSAHAHMLLTGDTHLTRKVLEDVGLSCRVCPGLLGVAPASLMQEVAEGSLLWPWLMWEYYQHSGDLRFLREMTPVLDGIMRYFHRYENGSGLLADVTEKWNLVDWPANYRDGYDFDLDPKTGGRGCQAVLNGHYYKFLTSCRAIRLALDLDTSQLSQKIDAFAGAYIGTFRDARTNLFVDAVGSSHSSLHANAMALYAGLVPASAKPAVLFFLRQKGMACGVWFAWFYLRGLMQAGQSELAFDLMMRDDEHSWTNMLREGATACMEAWGVEQKWNTSLCHAWAAAPVILLVEHFLGIQHAEPGWRAIRVLPRMPRLLSSASLHLPLPQGRLSVNYSRTDRLEMYSLHVPAEVKVTGPGPAGTWQAKTQDPARGTYIFEKMHR